MGHISDIRYSIAKRNNSDVTVIHAVANMRLSQRALNSQIRFLYLAPCTLRRFVISIGYHFEQAGGELSKSQEQA